MNKDEVVVLITEGIAAALGAQVVIRSLYEFNGKDPSNNDNYCRLDDWIKSAREQSERLLKE